MKIQEQDLLQALSERAMTSQREMAYQLGCSLGAINQSLKALEKEEYLRDKYELTEKAKELIAGHRTERAIILAAGFGLRMIPINQEKPKGLLEIHGEPIIEHTIRQLQEAGINDIVVVAGYLKEQYDYLEDQFGVKLVLTRDYATKNNLYSLASAADHLENAYIIPSDVYCYQNPFRRSELHSWYMVTQEQTGNTDVRVNRAGEIVYIPEGETGNRLIGIAYLTADDAREAKERLTELTGAGRNSGAFWEEIISNKNGMLIPARVVPAEMAVEINTYEQLRELEYYSRQLRNDVIQTIMKVFDVPYEGVQDIQVLKKGLTNRSFLFTVKGKRYIMRVPGEGTESFIDRHLEGRVYDLIRGRGFCDDNVYFDPETGYKIAVYIENARVCRDEDPAEVAECMRVARRVHEAKMTESAELDLYGMLDYYESLWSVPGQSQYRDYQTTKERIIAMRPFIEAHAFEKVLTQGDCNPDNFLVSTGPDGHKKIDLIDWEYSAVQDPLTDIAAFISYRMHDHPQEYADMVIDAYFPEGCDQATRLLIYCYVAIWGLYNSNWCEYKMALGVELGDFAITVYRYAKIFSGIFETEYEKFRNEHPQDAQS